MAGGEPRLPRGDNDLFGRHLDLPRDGVRERIEGRARTHPLDEIEIRTLATIGAFRVVPVEDLESAADLQSVDLRRLSNEGLITRETVTDVSGSQRIAALTSEGKAVLEAYRTAREDGPDQAFYAGVVKPPELAHDAQVYRAFKEEAARIDAEGGSLEILSARDAIVRASIRITALPLPWRVSLTLGEAMLTLESILLSILLLLGAVLLL